jgi:hypothetical protein
MAEEKKRVPGPGRQRGTRDQFTGRAGQLAVVAELLHRGCNAAIPEVDLGNDIFAYKENRSEMVHIQVKTNSRQTMYKDGSGYSVRFGIPMKQLSEPDEENRPLYYVLAVRREGEWIDFLVISRDELNTYWESRVGFGSENALSENLEITVEFRDQVRCSGEVLTHCRNAWHLLPPLRPQQATG